MTHVVVATGTEKAAKIKIIGQTTSQNTKPKIKVVTYQNLSPIRVETPAKMVARSQVKIPNDTTTYLSTKAKAQCLTDPGLKIRKR